MKKLVVVKQKNESSWVSCQSITRNLEEYYKVSHSEWDINTIYLEEGMNRFELYLVAKEIKQLSPDRITFIDHKPNPSHLLKILGQVLENNYPELLIHTFGDFVLQINEWASISDDLNKFKVIFYAASSKQAEILKNLFVDDKCIHVFPFPVNDKKFFYSLETRRLKRSELGVSEEETCFFYSGRLSDQKNILELIKTFDSMVSQLGLNLKLYIAGKHDDLSVPYLGKTSMVGGYYQNWLKVLNSLENKCVHYLGHLDQDELYQMYNASDCYISASTHNDEDYGMAIAEALSCGLPLILTDWGGFSDFIKIAGKNGRAVPVIYRENNIEIDFNILKKRIFSFSPLSHEQRISFVENSRKLFERDIPVKTNSFSGFSDLFFRVLSRFSTSPKAPFKNNDGGYVEEYYRLYKPYFSSGDEQ